MTRTTECWGFLESQETTAVSEDTFGDFVKKAIQHRPLVLEILAGTYRIWYYDWVEARE